MDRNSIFLRYKNESFVLLFWFLFAVVIVSLFVVGIWFDRAQSASPPSIVTYQGKLLESGVSVTTAKSMEFYLYDALTGGTCVYTASGTPAGCSGTTSTITVTPTSGIFAVDIGGSGTNTLDPTLFQNNDELYLEVWISGTKMTPRKRLTASPYALNSKYLDGVGTITASTTTYIPQSDAYGNFSFTGTPTTTGVSGGVVYINPASATANYTLFGAAVGGVEKFRIDEDGDTTVVGDLTVSTTFYTDVANGRVGINSTTPGYALSVSGTSYFANGDLNVDGGTLLVDYTNNRVGINSSTPGYGLSVNGTSYFTDDLTVSSTFYTDVANGRVGINSSTPGYALSVSGTSYFANGDFNVDGGTLLVDYTNNRVGINSTTPNYGLSVDSDAYFGGTNFYFAGTNAFNILNESGSARLGINTAAVSSYDLKVNGASFMNDDFTVSSSLFVDVSNGYIGINSSTPNYNLSVSGTSYITGNANFGSNILLADLNADGYNSLATDKGLSFYSTVTDDTLGAHPVFQFYSANTLTTSSGNFLEFDNGNTTYLSITNAGKLTVSTTDFSLGLNGDFSVDNGTFFVDAGSNYVGINSSTPNYNLTVSGTSYFSDTLIVGGSNMFTVEYFDLGGGEEGVAVGINTSTDAENYDLKVSGAGYFGDGLTLGGQLNMDGVTSNGPGISNSLFYLNAASMDSSYSLFSLGITDSEILGISAGGKVSINTTTANPSGFDYDLTVGGTQSAYFEGDVVFASGTTFSQGLGSAFDGTTTNFRGLLTSPTLVVSTNVVTSSNNGDLMVAQGDYMYVLAHNSSSIHSFNIESDGDLTSLGAVIYSSMNPTSLFVVGDFLYVSGNNSGPNLSIFDISDPDDMSFVISSSETNNCDKLVVSGQYVYLACNEFGTMIYDVSNPFAPIYVTTTIASETFVVDVDIVGNRMYLTDRSLGLVVYSIANPRNPEFISSVALGTAGSDAKLAVENNYAYIVYASSSFYRLEVYDVSRPQNMSLASTYDTVNPTDILVSGDYAYIANGGPNGVEIVDISNKSSLSQVSTITIGGSGYSHMLYGSYYYVIPGGSGIKGYDVTGAKASSMKIGSARISKGNFTGDSQFDKQVYIRGGANIEGQGLSIGGDFAMYVPGAATVLDSVTNTLRFSHKVLFETTATSSDSFTNAFIFNTTNAVSTSAYLFSVRSGGTSKFSIQGNGDTRIGGTLYAATTTIGVPGSPGDLAERVDVDPAYIYEAGDILVVDMDVSDRYTRSTGAYAKKIAGVVSQTAILTIGFGKTSSTAVMALTGRVPVKVSGENGPIQRGDLLVSASISGHAMKFDADTYTGNDVGIIGLALEPFDGVGTGKIMTLLKSGWVDGRSTTIAETQQALLETADTTLMPVQTDPTVLTVSETSGGQLVIGSQDVNFGGYALLNVGSILGKNSQWAVDVDGRFVTNVETSGGTKSLYALQSEQTEYIFSGTSTLVAGEGRVDFSAVTQELLDPSQPIKVSITLTAEANGVFISQKDTTGFTVKELAGGTSNATFDWLVVAVRNVGTVEAVVVPEVTTTTVEVTSTTTEPVSAVSSGPTPTEPAPVEPTPVVEPVVVDPVPVEPVVESIPEPAPEPTPVEPVVVDPVPDPVVTEPVVEPTPEPAPETTPAPIEPTPPTEPAPEPVI